jgi:hypothetical protein
MSSASLKFVIEGDPAPAVKAMQKVTGEAQKSFQTIGASFKKLASVGAGLVGAAGLASFFKSAMAQAEESQKVSAQTAAVITSTGAAANVSAKHVDDLANSISKYAGIDDEAIASGENMLLTFTNIKNEIGKGNDVFDQATKAATDMSVALGTDMTSAAKTLGIALNDPVKGMSKLQRAGVTFTQQQKDQVAAMVANNNTMGAQKTILAELSKEFGGSAAAQATASDKMKVALGNLEEEVGQALLPVIEGLANFLTDDVIPAFSAVVGWVKDNQTTVKILAGTIAGLWTAWKGYTILKSVSAAVSTAAAKYSQFVAQLSYGNRLQRTASSGLQSIGAAAGKVGSAVGGIAVGSTIGVLTRQSSTATKAMGVLASTAAGAAIGFSVAGPLGAAIGAGTGLLSSLATTLTGDSEATQRFKADMADLTAAIVENNGAVNDKARADAAAALEAKGVLEIAEQLHFPLSKVTDAALGNTAAFNDWADALNKAKTEIGSKSWRSALDMSLSQSSVTRMTDTVGTLGDIRDTMDGAVGAGHRMAAATDQTAESMRTATGAISDAGDAASTTKDAIDKLSSSFDKLNGRTIDAAEAEIAWQDSLTAVTKELKGHNKSLALDSKTGRDHLQVVFDSIKAAQDDAQATLQRTNSSKKARAAFQSDIGTLKQHMIALGFDKGKVQDLIAEYGKTPKFETTKFDAQTAAASQQARELQSQVDALSRGVIIPVHIEQSGTFHVPGSGVQGQASGTSSAPAGWSWVGERGPELMSFRGGERVLSHPQSMRVSRGYANGTGGGGTAPGPQRVTGRTRLEVDHQGGLWALIDGVVEDKLEHRRSVIGMDN